MDPGIFEFQTMMTTVANGMSGKMIPAIVNVAYIFMIISLMLGVYEAYARGGGHEGTCRHGDEVHRRCIRHRELV